MATYVPTNVSSGGVDLTKLTNGEQLCIGLLFNAIRVNPTSGSCQFWNTVDSASIDFSKIKNVVISYKLWCNSGSYMYTRFAFGSVEQYVYAQYSGQWATGSITLQNINQGSAAMFYVQNGNNTTQTLFKFASFTTTDGKVHTAANLNY